MNNRKINLILKSVILGFVLAFLFSQTAFSYQCEQMSDKLLRLHILANSNSEEDQQLKMELRDEILNTSSQLFENTGSKQEAVYIVESNIYEIQKVAQDFVRDKGYDYKVSCKIETIPFNTRQYDNVTIPAGTYDALRIIIGSGEGQNWWCVMFPPMCFSSAEVTEENLDKVLSKSEKDIVENEVKYEYKLKAVEVFNEIVNFFNEK